MSPVTPKALVLDAMGVMFEAASVVSEHLVPFVRSRGSDLPPEAIRDLYMRGSAGELDVEQVWRELAVRDPETATESYVQLHRLAPGCVDFLRWARSRGIELACLSNDVGAWALALRERHGLGPLMDHWVISGDVASRKPDAAIFHALRRAAGAPFEAWVFVEDDIPNLDAAARLGVRGVAFGTGGGAYPRVDDFDELTALVAELFEVPR